MSNNNTTSAPNVSAIKKLHFFILCNNIIDACVKKYYKETKNLYIPYDFITFYFDECQKQPYANKYLNAFFLCFNNNVVTFENIIEVYSKSKLPNFKLKIVQKDSLLSGLKAGKYIIADKHSIKKTFNYTIDSEDLKAALFELEQIIETLSFTKNITKTKYQIYIRQKNKDKLELINQKAEDQLLHKHQPLKTNKYAIAPPAQHKAQKVAKLIIPKLRVNGMYPKSITLSRVDSRYFAYTFMTPANQVRLVNIYHIKNVGFLKSFYDKRSGAQKTEQKKSRFDGLF